MDKKSILEQIKDLATSVMKFGKEEPKEEVKMAQEKLDNGTVIEADAFEPGQSVFIVNDQERVPLPIGEYEMNGKVIVVTEEGIIGEIKDAAQPAAMENEYVTVKQFNDFVEKISAMFSKQIDDAEKEKKELEDKNVELSKEKEGLEAKNVELQKELDEKPDAIASPKAPVEKEKSVEEMTNFEKLQYNKMKKVS